MQVQKVQNNQPQLQPCYYSKRYYWKSYIKFQLAVNFYYIWNCKYIILYILNYLIQRIHAISCNVIYNMSEKDSVPLEDNGYKIIPEINISTHGQLTAMLGGGVLFGLLKIIIKMDDNNYSFAAILSRYTVISSIAIFCRVISFLSTILPSPHIHCHNEDFNPPTGWGIITTLNLAKGCGDLVFSSHMMHFLCALFVVIWYVLPSYDQQRVMKLMDKIKSLRRKLQDSTQSYDEANNYRSKIGKFQKEMRGKYRSNMISNAQKMKRLHWRWAFIAFLPFFTLVFVFFIIASRGHYTIDVIVSLYFIPFMSYFVLHHWKEDTGKTLEKKVCHFYPRLCKSYIQILNNEDLAISHNISNYSDVHFQVPLQNGTTVEMTDSYQNEKVANGKASQSSQFQAASLPFKYEAINGEYRPKLNGKTKD